MNFSFNSIDLSDKEKLKLFREELQKFNNIHGNLTLRTPQMGGKELDLYKLFKEVISRGGASYVQENKLWKDVVNSLEVPNSCTSASFLLRNHYNKCLLPYEQYYLKSIGNNSSKDQQHNSKNKDDLNRVLNNNNTNNNYNNNSNSYYSNNANIDNKVLGKKIVRNDNDYFAMFRPIKYNNHVNKENKEKNYNKKVRLINAIPDLKRIVLSFESHITSEIIWAINVLLLFSSNQNTFLILDSQPYLLESISNYLYFCVNNISEFTSLFTSKNSTNSNYKQTKNIAQINLKENSKTQAITNSTLNTNNKEDLNNTDLLNKINLNIVLDLNQSSICSLPSICKKDRNLEIREKAMIENNVNKSREEVLEYELIEQLISITLIIRNLSLIKQNEPTIIRNYKTMNIIFTIFVYTNLIEIKFNCLDIICNLAKHIILKEAKNGLSLLKEVFNLVKSSNREVSETALECLRKLTFPISNEEYFEKLDDDFYKEMISLLIAFKNETRESALEILYFISDNMSCKSKIGKQPYSIERLVALLCSNSYDNRISKFSACILSNLATIPSNQKIIMQFEEQIFLASCVDENLTKCLMGIISN